MQTDLITDTDRHTVLSTTAAGLTGGLLATLVGSDAASAQTELSLSIDATKYGDVGGTGELRIETA